ncbi:DUF6932 family protein [Rothia nasimurium]|uniref:DUF6932 family protein n=1 Tax=Rothia nasimurium TaxID=85336 RepID=UPI003C6E6299
MLAPLQYPGTYDMTLDEIEQYFVTGAPYENERKELMNAFRAYAQTIWRVIPESELLLDGGFCTLKDWAAPEDIDVAFTVPSQYRERVNSDPSLQLVLTSLFTRTIKDPATGTIRRLRPFADQIDGYMVPLGLPPTNYPGLGLVTQEQYWHHQWSNVKAQDGTVHAGIRKGFIKVVNPWIL